MLSTIRGDPTYFCSLQAPDTFVYVTYAPHLDSQTTPSRSKRRPSPHGRIFSQRSSNQLERQNLRRQAIITFSQETTFPCIFGTCVILNSLYRPLMSLTILKRNYVMSMKTSAFSISSISRSHLILARSSLVATMATPTFLIYRGTLTQPFRSNLWTNVASNAAFFARTRARKSLVPSCQRSRQLSSLI